MHPGPGAALAVPLAHLLAGLLAWHLVHQLVCQDGHLHGLQFPVLLAGPWAAWAVPLAQLLAGLVAGGHEHPLGHLACLLWLFLAVLVGQALVLSGLCHHQWLFGAQAGLGPLLWQEGGGGWVEAWGASGHLWQEDDLGLAEDCGANLGSLLWQGDGLGWIEAWGVGL